MANQVSDIGAGLKGINFDAWGGIDNFLRDTSAGASGTQKPQQLGRVNPWLAKARDMTALAVSELPFNIVTKSGEILDSTASWCDKLGGIPSPQDLMYNLAASLCMGRAYLIPRVTGRTIVDMHYCSPHTVSPLITVHGLQHFSRSSDFGQSGLYYPASIEEKSGAYMGEMMYFWLPDSDVEIGPAKSYPAGVAQMSAELLVAIGASLKATSERGFVPPTILAAKGMAGIGEREKAENWWNGFLRGWTQTVAKIMNAESLTPYKIGAGMDELKGIYTELIHAQIENVAASYGIPAALFMSDMAFASEVNEMVKTWYKTSVFVKLYRCIETTFNTQLLDRFGCRMKFLPDTLDAFQEDETKRAASYREYISTRMRPSIAAEMLGLDMPDGIEYGDLDELYDQELDTTDTTEEEPVDQAEEMMPAAPVVTAVPKLDANQIKELNLWLQISVRCHKNGKGKAIDFECKYIPLDISEPIRLKLADAEDERAIIKAFEIDAPIRDTSGLFALADAINRAASKNDK